MRLPFCGASGAGWLRSLRCGGSWAFAAFLSPLGVPLPWSRGAAGCTWVASRHPGRGGRGCLVPLAPPGGRGVVHPRRGKPVASRPPSLPPGSMHGSALAPASWSLPPPTPCCPRRLPAPFPLLPCPPFLLPGPPSLRCRPSVGSSPGVGFIRFSCLSLPFPCVYILVAYIPASRRRPSHLGDTTCLVQRCPPPCSAATRPEGLACWPRAPGLRHG